MEGAELKGKFAAGTANDAPVLLRYPASMPRTNFLPYVIFAR
jgi:hypothetical protein